MRVFSQHLRGTTLIEALILVFILGIITVAFYQAWSTGTRLILETRNRLGALSVANEKMEIAHNLTYAQIGTKTSNGQGGWNYGIPGGDILQDEDITSNNHTYHVHTFVQYVDDAFDGKVSGTNPLDTVPSDYKKVEITVSWSDGTETHTLGLSSVFVPKGVEQSAGGGVLSINVIDTTGAGIPDATVRIINTQTNPHVDLTAETDSTGNLLLPGAPAASQSYIITVSKSSYVSVTTYPPAPTSAFTPSETHVSVVAGALNQTTLVTDRAADIKVKTQTVLNEDLPSVAFQIRGGKQIGTNPVTVLLDQTTTSGSGAEVSFAGASPGIYTLTPSDTSTRTLVRLDPPGPTKDTFSVAPGNNTEISMLFAPHAFASLLIIAQAQSTGAVIPGASVHVTNAGLGYDTTVTADAYGQAYLPTQAPALTAGTYEVEVSASGFESETASIDVNTALVVQNVLLESN